MSLGDFKILGDQIVRGSNHSTAYFWCNVYQTERVILREPAVLTMRSRQSQVAALVADKKLDRFFAFSECANTKQFWDGRFSEIALFPLGSIFPAARFKPGTAGCEARTLPLCYAVPPSQTAFIQSKKNSLKQNNLTYHPGPVSPPCGDVSPLGDEELRNLIKKFVISKSKAGISNK